MNAPIDDELRSMFQSRADLLSPAGDPLSGIERRARRMRRNRMAASVAGTAVAVAAIAIAVPSLVPDRGSSDVPRFATPGPSASTLAYRPSNALNWPTVAGTGALDDRVKVAWAADNKVRVDEVTLEVLYRGATGDKVEVGAYQLWAPTLPARVAIAASLKGNALLLSDELASNVQAYRSIVPGLAAYPWVVVVGSPIVVGVEYAENGADFVPQGEGRSAVFVRTGPKGAAADQVRTTDGKGIAYTQTANPPGASDGGTSEPTNLLSSWPKRGGNAQDDLIPMMEKAFAGGLGRSAAEVNSRVLFSGATDSGVRYLFGQAWFAGEVTAYNVGYTTGGEQGPEPFLGPATRKDATVLAFLVCCAPGTSTDTIVLIPQPGTGQVLYAESPQAVFVPKGQGQDYLDGVVLIDRNPRAQGDRIRLLDGHGATTYTGEVLKLLCGFSGCG